MSLRLAPIVIAGFVAGCGGPLSGNGSERTATGDQRRALGMLHPVAEFGSNPGNLLMYEYVPADMPENAPLVVALHGCTQTASDYAQVGWNELAETLKFYVVYAEQSPANNAGRCFNWSGEFGDPANLVRGQGENLSIKQMVDKMKADHSVDPRRVFVTGFSGGGAQTSVMLATWPDVFAAGGILAGIPFNCTTSPAEAWSCLSPGKDRTPEEWAGLVRDAYPTFNGTYPRIAILQGTNDNVVSPKNALELLEQWTAVHGIDQTADATSITANGNPRREYRDANGTTLVEAIDLVGLGHAVPVDPSSGCGTAGTWQVDDGFCASAYLAHFFGLIGAPAKDSDAGSPGPSSPPVVVPGGGGLGGSGGEAPPGGCGCTASGAGAGISAIGLLAIVALWSSGRRAKR